ncbi:hypothetical protein BZA77DRAFT_299033 [Pyronema omphalodes]|nr:hypothetical protein BZA77DRAFT_299033 [Pyronema omphalodes]
MDGIASTGDERSTGKIFNDSVIGIIDGKVGIISKSKSGYQWKPPMLTLNLQVICPFDRLPVRVRKGMELWVAVILQGHVVGDIDWPGAVGNAAGIGLDVGVLLDISSFTSPDSFVQMKAEAKRLIEAMETSRDRVVAMTFSSPHLGKRRASLRGRPHLKVINSTGSVSKKQLLEDLSALELGLVTDPNSRDVTAAINAAVKELRNMPPDNGRYGLKRSGHLFLLTTRLQSGEIQGNFKGIKVHVLGIGPIFNPSSAAGGDGWCAATSSPLDPVSQLQKIVADGVEVPVESPPKTNDVKSIVNILRMGLDLGVIQGGDLFLHPGQGCKIKAVLGDAAFPILRPGERKSLMVKIEVSDLPGFRSGDSSVKNVERQLKATLGELTSTILNAEAVYCHSHLSTPATTITTKAQAEVVRFVEGCIWSRSSQDINGDIPDFLIHDDQLQSAKATTDSVLVQVLANRHSSARDARNAIEQLKDVDAPAVLRELGYQVYLEDRYGTRTVTENSTTESFTEPMMEAFERRLSPGNKDMDLMRRSIANPTAKTAARVFDEENSDLLMDGSPGPGSENRSDQSSSSRFKNGRPDRNQSPDEARRLWMRLEGYDEDDVGALSMSDEEFDEFDDRNLYYGDDRSNHGEDTIVTYRNVRETDFSPWAV